MHFRPHRRGDLMNPSVHQRANGRWLTDQSERVINFCYVIKQNIIDPVPLFGLVSHIVQHLKKQYYPLYLTVPFSRTYIYHCVFKIRGNQQDDDHKDITFLKRPTYSYFIYTIDHSAVVSMDLFLMYYSSHEVSHKALFWVPSFSCCTLMIFHLVYQKAM